jgi:hypothetical protein
LTLSFTTLIVKTSIYAFALFIAVYALTGYAQISSVHPPPIVSISVCNAAGTGGPGSCPTGSFDTNNIVLAPDGSGNVVNSYDSMVGISDEHQSIFSPGTLQANSDYLFFVATRVKGGAPSTGVTVLSGGSGPNANGQWTMDFAKTDGYGSYASGYGTIFVAPNGPNCPTVADGNPAHQDSTFDLTYAAPGSVVIDPTSPPGNLLMVYEGTNTCFGIAGGANNGNNFYSSVAVATSNDYGHTWPTYRGKSGFSFVPLPGQNPSQGPGATTGALGASVCIGNDCAATPGANYGRYPILSPSVSISIAMALGTSLPSSMGDSEMSAFVDDASANPAQYLYAVYDYKAGTGALADANAPGTGLMIARGQLNGGTAPVSFSKWNGRAFAGAGMGGYDSPIFPAGPFGNCEAPAQLRYGSSLSYVDETQQYLLTFVCDSPGDPALGQAAGAARGAAWFFSTSYNLSDPTQWTPPVEITGSWSVFDNSGGCANYKGFYPTFMSLGTRPGHLSTAGYVFYLWGCQTNNTPPPGRQYSSRAFTISTASSPTFTVANRGGMSQTSSGSGNSISVGYGEIQPNAGNTTPAGIAIFDYHQNNILVSEVGVPATPALISGRMYAEIAGALNAGLAIANPNSSPATINFYFTDTSGNSAGSGSTTIGANQQVAQFLDQSPFKVYPASTFQGTFSFTSSVPVAVIALRGYTNERGEFLMSTLPIIDTTAPPNNGTVVASHFADGGGWTTNVLLVNPTDNPMTGTVQFFSQAGTAANVTIGGQTNSSFTYSISKRSSQKLSTSGLAPAPTAGSIQVIPAGGGASPTELVVFSNKPGGVTVSEAGVPVTSGTAFRTYVEYSGVPGQSGNINSGIAVANLSAASATVTFDITDLTGTSVSGIAPVMIQLPGNGQVAKFLSDIFPSLPKPLKGILRITTTSTGLSVVGLRTQINERNDFLITTTPPTNENALSTASPMYFPQVADGGGFTTEFILFSGTAGEATSGVLKLIRQDGTPFGITLN